MSTEHPGKFITTDMESTASADDELPFLFVSEEVDRQSSMIISIILNPLICAFGITVNVIGLCVLSRDPKKTECKIFTYLFSMLIFNIVFLAAGPFAAVVEIAERIDFYSGNKIRVYIGQIRGFAEAVSRHVLSGLLIAMSSERLISLAFPYSAKSFCFSKHPRLITLGIFIGMALCTISGFSTFRIQSYRDNENQTMYEVVSDPDLIGLFNVYVFINTFVLRLGAPLLVLSLNIFIVVLYSRFNKRRKSLNGYKSRDLQSKITAIVLSVAGLYVLAALVNIFIQTLAIIDGDYLFYGKYRRTLKLFLLVGDLMVRVNATADFALYILVSDHYRAIFYSMFVTCRRKKRVVCGKHSDTNHTAVNNMQ